MHEEYVVQTIVGPFSVGFGELHIIGVNTDTIHICAMAEIVEQFDGGKRIIAGSVSGGYFFQPRTGKIEQREHFRCLSAISDAGHHYK